MHVDLIGKVALVTGGRGAIGGAIAQYLARYGAIVAVSDLAPHRDDNDDDGSPIPALSLDHDVTSAESWSSVVAMISDSLGPIDILCNSAGVRPPITPIQDVTLDDLMSAYTINAGGTLLGCQAVLPQMRERRYGKIINVSSTMGKETLGGSAAYGASKHAVIALTQSVAYEVGSDNINVNAVCPGPVDSPMLSPSGDQQPDRALVDRLAALSPMGRIIEVHDVAELVAFLASESARNIHGQSINIDGGRSTHT